MGTKTVRVIVADYLRAIGADGLCAGPDIGESCGCGLDDLMPCSDDCAGCVPAKLVPVPEDEREDCFVDEWYVPMEVEAAR